MFLTYTFLIVIFGFAILAGLYLYVNDFAKETIEVLFPAVGAILFSLYLGIKTVVIDAPEHKTFNSSIAILHDDASGMIRGMAPRTIKHSPQYMNFRGSDSLDTLLYYNDFKALNLPNQLKGTSSETATRLEDLLEYSILEWFTNDDVQIGYVPYGSTQLIQAFGGGGGIPPLPSVSAKMSINSEPNALLKVREIKLPLPKGSKIIRKRKPLSIEIVTPCSRLAIRFTGRTYEKLSGPIGEDATKIYQALGLPAKPEHLNLYDFGVYFDASQVSLYRFSRQAKIEAKWIDTVFRQFQKDFSWEQLRAFYTK